MTKVGLPCQKQEMVWAKEKAKEKATNVPTKVATNISVSYAKILAGTAKNVPFYGVEIGPATGTVF